MPMMFQGRATLTFLICLGILRAPPAWAAAGCSVSSSGAAFGVYTPTNATATTTTATVSVTCQAAIQIAVAYVISLGPGSSGSVAARTMLGGISRMSYQLYTNPTFSTVWGDGTNGSQTVSDGYLLNILTPVTNNYTAYGRIPALQNLSPATYTDTVIVQITY